MLTFEEMDIWSQQKEAIIANYLCGSIDLYLTILCQSTNWFADIIIIMVMRR